MKLFKISQTANDDYDTFDSAIVAAADEEIARRLNPTNYGPVFYDFGRDYGTWAPKLEDVKVEYLGEAKEGTVQQIICASFNAG